MRVLAVLAVLALAASTDAIAQEQPLQPGQLVRVTVPSLDVNKHKATFQRMSGDTLVLESASYSLPDVTRLDVYRGRKSWGWWKGALIGFFGGAAIGLGVGVAVDEPGSELYGLRVALGGAIGAGSGLLLGTWAGIAIRTDKWEQVPLDRLRVSVVPQRGGRFGFGVSAAF